MFVVGCWVEVQKKNAQKDYTEVADGQLREAEEQICKTNFFHWTSQEKKFMERFWSIPF